MKLLFIHNQNKYEKNQVQSFLLIFERFAVFEPVQHPQC